MKNRNLNETRKEDGNDRALKFCEVCKKDQDLDIRDDGHTRCYSCEDEIQRNKN